MKRLIASLSIYMLLCGALVMGACNRVTAQSPNNLVVLMVNKDLAIEAFTALDNIEYLSSEQARRLLTEKLDGRRVALILDERSIESLRTGGVETLQTIPSRNLFASLQHALGIGEALRRCRQDELVNAPLVGLIRPPLGGYCRGERRCFK